MSLGVIGGADGPTAIFVSSPGPDWFNPLGMCYIIALLIPNIIYAFRYPSPDTAPHSKTLLLLEQIGRYGSMFFMVINLCSIGLPEYCFPSFTSFLIYLIGCPVTLLLYWICWFFYGRKQSLFTALLLAILPTILFLVCGVIRQHWLLILTAVIFGIGHVAITWQSHRKAL